jgi:MFS family permease
LDELQVGLVFIGGPAMYMVLAAVFGGLADKFGTRGFIVSGFLITGVAFFFIGPGNFITTPRLWLTIVAFLLMGVGLAPAFIPSYADLLKIAKTQHPEVNTEVLTGVVSGLTSATLSLGEFIGPLLGASLTQFTDFQTSTVVRMHAHHYIDVHPQYIYIYTAILSLQLLGQVLWAQAFLLLGATLIDRFHNHRQSP